MNGIILPDRIYSIRDLDRLTHLGCKNIERSLKRGAIPANRLDGRFFMIKVADFLQAVERDERGEVYLSKPHTV